MTIRTHLLYMMILLSVNTIWPSFLSVGQHTIKGDGCIYKNGDQTIYVKQLKVINQMRYGGSASCGYHALSNAKHVMEGLENNVYALDQELYDTNAIKERFGKQGIWRYVVRCLRSEMREWNDGDWVEMAEIQNLLSQEDKKKISIYADPDEISQPEEFNLYYNINDVKEHVHTSNYVHAFILGSMSNEISGKKYLNSGHWISAVLHIIDEKTCELFVMDSLGKKGRHTHPAVQQLLRKLFGEVTYVSSLPNNLDTTKIKNSNQDNENDQNQSHRMPYAAILKKSLFCFAGAIGMYFVASNFLSEESDREEYDAQ